MSRCESRIRADVRRIRSGHSLYFHTRVLRGVTRMFHANPYLRGRASSQLARTVVCPTIMACDETPNGDYHLLTMRSVCVLFDVSRTIQ